MRLYRARDRADLYHKIYIYKQRRDELRRIHGWKNGVKVTDSYRHAVFNINERIKHWEKMIDVIDRNKIRLIAISNAIIYFFGIDIKKSVLNMSPRYKQARNVFYKYCLENNLSATLVAEYIGVSRGDVVARARLTFTKSFEKTPKNKEIYMNFCSYIKELSEQ